MDSAQATVFINELKGTHIGGWQVTDHIFGFGKSAVVVGAVKKGEHGALKVFHPELVEQYGHDIQYERIRREGALVGAEHQNVVSIIDAGKCPASHYLYVVMEPLEWKNLKEELQNIPAAQIRKIIEQIASAAMYLEEKGLAHRDIKPENIAISPDYTQVKLLDLGIVRPIGVSDLTDLNGRPFIGTLRYSSPEFLRREEVDSLEGWRAVTFYQIGAVLHDLLMRAELFSEYSDPFSLLVEAVCNVEPELHGDDAALIQLCKHCLCKKPDTRLKIISWHDFFEINDDKKEQLVLIREDIRKRQLYYLSQSNNQGQLKAEGYRLSKQKLERLCFRFEREVGITLSQLNCFPLRNTQTAINMSEKTCLVRVFFEKDLTLGLLRNINLCFSIKIEDDSQQNTVIAASHAIAISDRPLSIEEFKNFNVFFMSNEDELFGATGIEETLLKALDFAYQLNDQTPNNEIIFN